MDDAPQADYLAAVNALSPPPRPDAADSPDCDVAIVGAGISGIGMAAHLTRRCPDKRFVVLERREAIGGTWDLFRYPGVRSDSDMHTLGFEFAPWRGPSIAGGEQIRGYLERVAAEHGITRHIRFGRKVIAADWDSAAARWTLTGEKADGGPDRLTCRFLFLGSGYYDHDAPHDPPFAGRETFAGRIVHPQFWPDDLDWKGKRVVVIGSGATAATLVPALAGQAGHVTMLQRTPSWYFARPSRDAVADTLHRLLPERWAYRLTRLKNILIQDVAFRRARSEPERIGGFLKKQARRQVGERFDQRAFTPPYGPWQQRLCLLPDGDLFAALRDGHASIVTGEVARFDADGIVLASGERLPADVIVTATGLNLAVAGKIAVSIDGEAVRWNERFYHRNCMFSGVSNFAALFGYINAAWTLRVDLVGRYLCRVLNRMDAVGAQVVTPVPPADATLEEDEVLDFTSGYIERSRHHLPRSATALPWRLNQDYLADRKDMRRAPLDDGTLRFTRAGEAVAARDRSAAASPKGDQALSPAA